jgi:O-antigen/teichoic acid export membrane protein
MSTPETHIESAGRHFAHAVAWTAAAKWSVQLISWISLVLVMRVLSPEVLGIVGLATAYVGFMTLLTEFGIGLAVLNVANLPRQQVSQLHALSVLIGAAGTAASALAAPFIAEYFRTPALSDVIMALGMTCLIGSAKSIPSVCLQKKLKFRAIALTETGQTVVQAIVSLGLAYAGFSFWSIVLGNIVGTVVGTIPLLLIERVPFALPNFSQLHGVLRFSRDVLVSRIAWYLYSNSDFVVAGHVLGNAAVGVYSFAWNFANLPGEKITTLILRVTPAFFAAVQEDRARLRRYLCLMTEMLSIVMFPIVVGLALVADDFVMLVFGQKWVGAIPVLQLLAIYAFYRSVVSLLPQVLNAIGESRFGMWSSMWTFAAVVPAFYFASRWGVVGIAAVWVIVYPVTTVPLFNKTLRLLEMSWADYLSSIRPPFVSCLVMTVFVIAAKWYTSGIPTALRLFLAVGLGSVVYVTMLRFAHPDRWSEYRVILDRIRFGGAASTKTLEF